MRISIKNYYMATSPECETLSPPWPKKKKKLVLFSSTRTVFSNCDREWGSTGCLIKMQISPHLPRFRLSGRKTLGIWILTKSNSWFSGPLKTESNCPWGKFSELRFLFYGILVSPFHPAAVLGCDEPRVCRERSGKEGHKRPVRASLRAESTVAWKGME